MLVSGTEWMAETLALRHTQGETMRRGIFKSTVLALSVLANIGCVSHGAKLALREWERGIAVAPLEQATMAMYLWFYEWNLFGAVNEAEHTPGGFRGFKRQVRREKDAALVTSETMRLSMQTVADGVELRLSITNRSDHDWPPLAAIIPCFNPGPKEAPNRQFANTRTYFLTDAGLQKQQQREIHFNAALSPQLETFSPAGEFAFSHKWPTSEVEATRGILMRESTDGHWVTGIAWEDFLSAQGHNPWQCMHLSIRVGPLQRGETREIRGKIYLFKGTREACLERFLHDFS